MEVGRWRGGEVGEVEEGLGKGGRGGRCFQLYTDCRGVRGQEERFRDSIFSVALTTVGIWLILLLMILAKAMVYNMDLLGQVTV